jgi:hypothetical protein
MELRGGLGVDIRVGVGTKDGLLRSQYGSFKKAKVGQQIRADFGFIDRHHLTRGEIAASLKVGQSIKCTAILLASSLEESLDLFPAALRR